MIEGSGSSRISGETFASRQADTFSAPVFSQIEHTAQEEAYIIRIHDAPLQQKLDFYEERPTMTSSVARQYAFAPPPQPAIPIEGETALDPVHRIFCVGRNYAEHSKEMGFEQDREAPCASAALLRREDVRKHAAPSVIRASDRAP